MLKHVNRTVPIAILILSMALLAFLVFLAKGATAGLFVFLCFLPLTYLSVPIFLSAKIDFFQPVTFFILNVLLGVSLRSLLMIFDTSLEIEETFFRGEPLSFFFPSIFWINISSIFFLLGYMLKFKVKPFRSNLLNKSVFQWKKHRFWIMMILLTFISIYSTVDFIRQLSIADLDVSNFSKKRFLRVDGQKVALGYHRLGASMAQLVFYFLLIHAISYKKKVISLTGVFLVVAFFLALLFPIFTNTKGDVVILLINAMMIIFYLKNRSVSFSVPIIAGVIALVLLLVLDRARKGNIEETEDIYSSVSAVESFGSIVKNRNYLGVSKTGHIMNSVPSKMNFAFGSTMITWIYAPIPRVLWKDKPIVVTGPIIRNEVYGEDWLKKGGIPPGLTAELFWNFGYPGIIIGSFLLGVFSKILYLRFLLVSTKPNFVLVYIYVLQSLVFMIVGAGVIYGLMAFLKSVILVYIFILILSFPNIRWFGRRLANA